MALIAAFPLPLEGERVRVRGGKIPWSSDLGPWPAGVGSNLFPPGMCLCRIRDNCSFSYRQERPAMRLCD